eukprot:s286_g29.t2
MPMEKDLARATLQVLRLKVSKVVIARDGFPQRGNDCKRWTPNVPALPCRTGIANGAPMDALREALQHCVQQHCSRRAERELRSLLAFDGASCALHLAAVDLALREPSCPLADLLGILRACDDAQLAPRMAETLAEELITSRGDFAPRILELMQQMLKLGWVQMAGLVAIVEELAALEVAETRAPASLALLDSALRGSRPEPGLISALMRAPKVSQLLVDHHAAILEAYPALAQAATPLLAPSAAPVAGTTTLPAAPRRARRAPASWRKAGGTSHAEADSEGESSDGHQSSLGPVVFEAMEDVLTDGASSEGLLPFALLPTVLSDVRHMGLLLAGARGVLEEWDLDTGLRLDRMTVAEEDADVVSIAAPHWTPHEVLAAAVNCPEEAGLALLRREADVWQVESPWPSTQQKPGWRHLARCSRIEFFPSSQSLLAMGQTSALGCHEIGLYDVALDPRPLTACQGHFDFVADLCSISSQSFASVGMDGSMLLWDFRSPGPCSKAGFGAKGAPESLSSVATSRGLVLCGSLRGDLCFFDLRKLSEPLMRPPSVRGAVVRLQLWPVREQQLVAAVASSEEGLCSLTVGGSCATGVLHPARYQPPLEEPRLFYDVACAGCYGAGPGHVIFACSDGGVTRFQAAQRSGKRILGSCHSHTEQERRESMDTMDAFHVIFFFPLYL